MHASRPTLALVIACYEWPVASIAARVGSAVFAVSFSYTHLDVYKRQVVAIARRAVLNNLAPVDLADLIRFEWLDHAVLLRHAADPLVGFDGHRRFPETVE